VRSIIINKETPPLILRLTYIKFVRVIEDLKDTTATERLVGREPRERGCRDTSIAINYYLTFKGVASDKASRTQVSRCIDIG
jgi:hypothetical protein